MIRIASALVLAALAASPAFATNYSAKPIAPASQKVVARDVIWACGPAACQGSSASRSPRRLAASRISSPTGAPSLRPSSTAAMLS